MVGLYVDVPNLYTSVRNKFDGGRLDYRKYLTACGDVDIAVAYLDRAYGDSRFIKMLGHREIEIEEDTSGIKMAVEMLLELPKLDTIIIGSNNPDFAPVISHAFDLGVKVIICAVNIPAIKGITKIEITEDMLL